MLPSGNLQQAVLEARLGAIIQITELYNTIKDYFRHLSDIQAAKEIGAFPYIGISGQKGIQKGKKQGKLTVVAELWSVNYNGITSLYETYRIKEFDLINKEDFLSFLWLSSHITELIHYNEKKFPLFQNLCPDLEYQGESVHNMSKDVLVAHIKEREDASKQAIRDALIVQLKRVTNDKCIAIITLVAIVSRVFLYGNDS